MRPIISLADVALMAFAAAACFLPAQHMHVFTCVLAIIAANLAFFIGRLVRTPGLHAAAARSSR